MDLHCRRRWSKAGRTSKSDASRLQFALWNVDPAGLVSDASIDLCRIEYCAQTDPDCPVSPPDQSDHFPAANT